jgi:hypothetical protein
MKRVVFVIMLAWSAVIVFGQAKVPFNEYFVDKAMRVDIYLVGDAKEEFATLDHIYQEGIWPENPDSLIEPFENGSYSVKVYDIASNRLVYSRGFSDMSSEYRTTTPALNGMKRVFERSVRIPFPKRPILFVLESRDKANLLHPFFTEKIDPADYHIIKEPSAAGDFIYEALKNGDPHEKVDLVFIAEGYLAEDKDKFKADVDRFAGYLFEIEPYKRAKEKFNITGILRPSPERAMDEPRQGIFKKTSLNASFNAFDLDRYMLIEEGHRLREIAAQAPYDTIVVLVNSKRYGGGGIYNDYCDTTVDNSASKQVFVHEFGHSFAGLADEYYMSDVAYNDFYPKGVEPLEPNITALLDPKHVKWQDLLSPGIPIPTEYGKEKIEALLGEGRTIRETMRKELESAKQSNAPEKKIKAIEEKYRKMAKETEQKLQAVRSQYSSLDDKVGAFEGAGYSAKGLYRPMIYCLMISSPKNEFCLVCQQAISRMIEYYAGPTSAKEPSSEKAHR